MDGILNINKPSGPSSFSIVKLIRKLTGVKKVGHAGTLDPLASGVLPICLGKATKLIQYLHRFPKTYRAVIQLGVVTDTYNGQGKIIRQKDPSYVTLEMVKETLALFLGEIEQCPPPYSAVKLSGTPLYSLARRGIQVLSPSRKVHIYKISIVDFSPPLLTLEVEVGSGTYIRSLAYDLGEKLGCGANAKETIRLKYGIFSLEEAISPEKFEQACREGNWQTFLYPINKVLARLPI